MHRKLHLLATSSLIKRTPLLASVRRFAAAGSRGNPYERYGTTILCVRKGDRVVLAGDGQVTNQSICQKPNARKLRRLGPDGNVITGFAGSTADAFTLLERLEAKLEEFPGQVLRACVELAKSWRTDRYLRNLEAAIIVADESISLEVIGNGDVLESHDGVIGVGSGGHFATAAARALYDIEGLSARDICEKAMNVAADMCVYTNHNIIYEELPSTAKAFAKVPQNSKIPSSSPIPLKETASDPTPAKPNGTSA